MPEQLSPPHSGQLFVLSGPSGVGKDTVLNAVRSEHPDVWTSTSVTTRPRRPGETEGVEYYFVDTATFTEMEQRGEFLETAQYAGNLYGTPLTPVHKQLAIGKPALLVIELQGARTVRDIFGKRATLVFLEPPSMAELKRRLRKRDSGDTNLAQRLKTAEHELAASGEFDRTIVNADLEETVSQLIELLGLSSKLLTQQQG